MKQSLLDMVQNIMLAMSSDPVNSIADTPESLQVADIVRDTYYELYNSRYWPHTLELFGLDASTDSELPTQMRIPTNVTHIEWLKYDISEGSDPEKQTEIQYMEPDEFHIMTAQRKSTDDNVVVVEVNRRKINCFNDTNPQYWTSFDDEYIIFDSYNSNEDSTIQESKVVAFGYKEPTFKMKDNFIPDMPAKVFPYFLSESKSVAFNQLKQTANAKEEQKARRQRMWLSREKHRAAGGIKFPINYGRK